MFWGVSNYSLWPMEKTHFCILSFLAFVTSLGNSDDYKELRERLVQLNKEERKIVEEREEIQQMLEDTLDDPYKYDDYNYDNKYDYDNQKPDDYTDDYSQKFIDDYYEHNLPNPPPLPSPPLPPPTPMSPFWGKIFFFFLNYIMWWNIDYSL